MRRCAGRRAVLLTGMWLGVLAGSVPAGPVALRGPDESWESRRSMGTLLEIAVRGAGESQRRRWLEVAYREADRLEQEFSNWRDGTGLSDFNARAGLGFQPVSRDLGAVLRLANKIGLDSSGAFDVSLGAAILARRRGGSAQPLLPQEARGERGRLLISGQAAALTRPGMAADLGGIAKGYTVDRICELLERSGATEGLVDFGRSSIRAFGPRPWKVALPGRRPGPTGVIELRGRALGTSESSEAADAILDPATGRPSPGSVTATVTHCSAAVADAWSTAVIVLGRSRAPRAWADSEELEVWLVDSQGTLHLPARSRRAPPR